METSPKVITSVPERARATIAAARGCSSSLASTRLGRGLTHPPVGVGLAVFLGLAIASAANHYG